MAALKAVFGDAPKKMDFDQVDFEPRPAATAGRSPDPTCDPRATSVLSYVWPHTRLYVYPRVNPMPQLELELLTLKSENRELRLKAGAMLTADDDALIFEEFLARLSDVLKVVRRSPPLVMTRVSGAG